MRQHTSLGHVEAQLAIGTIQAELRRREKAAVIAVADDHGELIGLLRLDGAALQSGVIATGKAWTAAREKKPTYDLGQAARDPKTGFDIAYYGDLRAVGWGGGVPVVLDGVVVGSVAVSGLRQEEDMELAGLAVAAIVEAAARTS